MTVLICGKCGERHQRVGQRHCTRCHTNYMREWRKTHKSVGPSRQRELARTRARIYFKRGWINMTPCVMCGDKNAEMHHPDYSRPLHVYWLCREHHLAWHALERANPATSFDEWLPPGAAPAIVGALSCEINASFTEAA